jgi:hydrogenase expression/formation protein HypE
MPQVLPITRELVKLPGLRFMRDPTRGGSADRGARDRAREWLRPGPEESRVPVRDAVRSVCEMLGYDPYHLAARGIVAVVAAEEADRALESLQRLSSGEGAQVIGRMQEQPRRVVLRTTVGGERVLEELEDDPLPRIC